jgi:hypothetical protein
MYLLDSIQGTYASPMQWHIKTHRFDDVVLYERICNSEPPIYRPMPRHEEKEMHPAISLMMKQCWSEEPAERMSFEDVMKTLKIINHGK